MKFQTTHTISKFGETLPTTVKFPLCFRHDLCFWLKNGNTENQLLTAILQVADDIVHSVRLIKVLHYEDSDMISYCYRIIYCRVDGPLCHLESVILQNNLRKHLLKIGFELR